MGVLGKLADGMKKLGHKVTDNLSRIGKKLGVSSSLTPNFDFNRMTNVMKIRAKLAQLAYETPKKRPLGIQGYNLDKEFNKTYNMVYVGKSDVYLVFRGTSPTDVRDLVSDYKIVKGEEAGNERFREALKIAEAVHKKYPNKKIYTVGHSLGGTLAQFVDREKDYVKKGIGFNPGAGKGSLERAFLYGTGLRKADKTLISHHVIGDPISMASGLAGGKRYTYPTRGASSHSIDNFN